MPYTNSSVHRIGYSYTMYFVYIPRCMEVLIQVIKYNFSLDEYYNPALKQNTMQLFIWLLNQN